MNLVFHKQTLSWVRGFYLFISFFVEVFVKLFNICDLYTMFLSGREIISVYQTNLFFTFWKKSWSILVSLFEEGHLSLSTFVSADVSVQHATNIVYVRKNFNTLARSKWFREGFSFNVLHITLNHTHFNFFGPFPSLISSVFRLTVTDSNVASISPPLQTGILSQAWRKAWRLFWRASLFKNNGAPVWNWKACV